MYYLYLYSKGKIIKTKHQRLKKYVLGCHHGWMDRFGCLFMETWQHRLDSHDLFVGGKVNSAIPHKECMWVLISLT